jgi:hypothetical protein
MVEMLIFINKSTGGSDQVGLISALEILHSLFLLHLWRDLHHVVAFGFVRLEGLHLAHLEVEEGKQQYFLLLKTAQFFRDNQIIMFQPFL